jgi:hypothetical protein
MPPKCPVCGGGGARGAYIAHRCISPFCGAQRLERLRRIRAVLDIGGLGTRLTQLIDRELAEDPAICSACETAWELDGFADKSAQNPGRPNRASRESSARAVPFGTRDSSGWLGHCGDAGG